MGYDVSVIIVAYNSKRYLEKCITSVMDNNPQEIIVVDNCSTDGTVDLIRSKYPFVRLIQSDTNLGYGGGNNSGAQIAEGDYLVILNPDTIVEKDCLKELLAPLKNTNIITTPKILLYDGSAINTCGNINHFTGLTFTRGFLEDRESFSQYEFVSGISGCCFAIKKEDFVNIGGFNRHIFMYNDDAEFSWRAHLKGFEVIYVPTAIVKHNYSLSVSSNKLYHLERGRYIILRECIDKRELWLIWPSLIVTEILTFAYAASLGRSGLASKLRALVDGMVLDIKRIDGDKRGLFRSLKPCIPLDQLTGKRIDRVAIMAANIIFSWNYRLIS